MRKSTVLLAAGAALTIILPLFASNAYAGCDPACGSGEVCRYEAAGGTYYCAASKSVKKGIAKGGLRYESANPGTNRGDDLLK